MMVEAALAAGSGRSMRGCRIVLFFAVLMVAISLSSPGLAADEADRLRKEAEGLGRKIEESRAGVAAFTRTEKELVERLSEIDRSMNEARLRISVIRSEAGRLEQEIASTEIRWEQLRDNIQRLRQYASGRLSALYKLSRLGSISILASADTLDELVRRKTAIERILSHDRETLRSLVEAEGQLAAVQEELHVRRLEKKKLEGEYGDQTKKLSREREERARILSEVRQKKSLELAALDAFQDAARRLEEEIGRLRRPPVAERREASPESKIFSGLKGLLQPPVRGKIVTRFGPYKNPEFNVESFRSGIDFASERGEPIRAVFPGRILFAAWFKGYGNMIIIDHGNSYYTVYAHAEELFKKKGDAVGPGEVIATVGETGSLQGPGLYFEVRHHGKPVDPAEWLNVG